MRPPDNQEAGAQGAATPDARQNRTNLQEGTDSVNKPTEAIVSPASTPAVPPGWAVWQACEELDPDSTGAADTATIMSWAMEIATSRPVNREYIQQAKARFKAFGQAEDVRAANGGTTMTIAEVDSFEIDMTTEANGDTYLTLWFNGEPYQVPADASKLLKMRDAMEEALGYLRSREDGRSKDRLMTEGILCHFEEGGTFGAVQDPAAGADAEAGE